MPSTGVRGKMPQSSGCRSRPAGTPEVVSQSVTAQCGSRAAFRQPSSKCARISVWKCPFLTGPVSVTPKRSAIARRTFPIDSSEMSFAFSLSPMAARHDGTRRGCSWRASSKTTLSRRPVSTTRGNLVKDFCGLRMPPMALNSSCSLTFSVVARSVVVMTGPRFDKKSSSRGSRSSSRGGGAASGTLTSDSIPNPMKIKTFFHFPALT